MLKNRAVTNMEFWEKMNCHAKMASVVVIIVIFVERCFQFIMHLRKIATTYTMNTTQLGDTPITLGNYSAPPDTAVLLVK